MPDRVTLPVQFCRDGQVFDFAPVRKNWDSLPEKRWKRQNDACQSREYEILDDMVVLPATMVDVIPTNASLTRDIVAGLSTMYLMDSPSDHVLRGKLIYRLLETIGMSYNGRAFEDVENILITLSKYRIYNQSLWRFNPKTKKPEEYRATFGFVNDYLRLPGRGKNDYDYSIQINRIYADMLKSQLPRASISKELLVKINSANKRVITPAKNIAYAIAAQGNHQSIKYKIDKLNAIAGYQLNKPSRMQKQVLRLLEILHPILIAAYEIDGKANITIDIASTS